MQETQKMWEDSREQANGATLQYSAWSIPWTEEPGGLQSMNGSIKSQTQLSAEHTHTIRAEGMQTSEVLSAFPVILSHCKQTMDLFTGSQSKH